MFRKLALACLLALSACSVAPSVCPSTVPFPVPPASLMTPARELAGPNWPKPSSMLSSVPAPTASSSMP